MKTLAPVIAAAYLAACSGDTRPPPFDAGPNDGLCLGDDCALLDVTCTRFDSGLIHVSAGDAAYGFELVGVRLEQAGRRGDVIFDDALVTIRFADASIMTGDFRLDGMRDAWCGGLSLANWWAGDSTQVVTLRLDFDCMPRAGGTTAYVRMTIDGCTAP